MLFHVKILWLCSKIKTNIAFSRIFFNVFDLTMLFLPPEGFANPDSIPMSSIPYQSWMIHKTLQRLQAAMSNVKSHRLLKQFFVDWQFRLQKVQLWSRSGSTSCPRLLNVSCWVEANEITSFVILVSWLNDCALYPQCD